MMESKLNKYTLDLDQLLMNFEFIQKNKILYFEILKNVDKSFQNHKVLNIYTSNLITFTYQFGYKFLITYFKPFQIFYLIYQSSVLIIVLIKSANIYFNLKSKIIKWISHGLWFMSALFVLLGVIIITYFYILGSFNIIVGNILYKNSVADFTNLTEITSCYNPYNQTKFHISDADMDKIQYTPKADNILNYSNTNKTFNQNNDFISALNDISMGIIENYVMSRKYPFDNTGILEYLHENILKYIDPYEAIFDQETSVVKNAFDLLNNLLNNQGYYPLKTYLSCNENTDIEIYMDKKYCKYAFEENKNSGINNGNCYLIQNINRDNFKSYIDSALKNIKCDCSKFIKDEEFCKKFNNSKLPNIILQIYDNLILFYNEFIEVIDRISKEVMFR